MKLDKIRFAMLIGFISKRYSMTIIGDDIAEIDRIIDVDILDQPLPFLTDAGIINEMFNCMINSRKIEAIKYYRQLTGCGLKDSKDAVEMITSRLA